MQHNPTENRILSFVYARQNRKSLSINVIITDYDCFLEMIQQINMDI